MLAKVKNILEEAMGNGYAVGAFNVFNMEQAQAVVRAAVNKHTPAIIQVTGHTLDYGGEGIIYDVVKSVIERESASIPIGFHLDHGKNLEMVERAVSVGLDSVMIDAANEKLRENMEMTKKVVEYAHPRDVSVQAELGIVPSLGEFDQNPNWEELMTNPLDAKLFVEETGVDSLAVAIGNAHGFFRERPEPDWPRLEEIHKLIPKTPLIIHGGSDWVNHKVVEAVKRGVACFNVDTDLRIAFNTVLCQFSRDKCEILDPRKILSEAREAVQKVVEKKIDLFRNIQ